MTCQELASYWPHQGDDTPGADFMNPVQKHVVSPTLQHVDVWQNSTLIDGSNVVAEIKRLKAMPGKNVNVTGSAKLVQSLLRENLLDAIGPVGTMVRAAAGFALLILPFIRDGVTWRDLLLGLQPAKNYATITRLPPRISTA